MYLWVHKSKASKWSSHPIHSAFHQKAWCTMIGTSRTRQIHLTATIQLKDKEPPRGEKKQHSWSPTVQTAHHSLLRRMRDIQPLETPCGSPTLPTTGTERREENLWGVWWCTIHTILQRTHHPVWHPSSQETYMSVLKPQHSVVREYLQDLLNKGWITPSWFIHLFIDSTPHYKGYCVKVTPRMCELIKSSAKFLGKFVAGAGYTMDPAQLPPVMVLKKAPATVGEVCQMLGFLSYYRHFIYNFSHIAYLLYNLLTLPKPGNHNLGPTTGKAKKTGKKSKGHLPSCTPIQQPSGSIESADWCTLKASHLWASRLHRVICPMLWYITNWPGCYYIIYLLYQWQQGKMRVTAYDSLTLSHTEKTYHLHSGKL